ncbi:MAG: DNA-protecting protein DprA [Treponema sp.]|nr:DNA-protecting protein DprA [Treponema sp.]
MPVTEKDIIICALSSISFLNQYEKNILFKKLDSSNAIALLSLKAIESLTGKSHRHAKFDGVSVLHDAKISAAILNARKISYCIYEDKEYPELLKEIPDFPFALFYRGNISVLHKKCVSVVGTRHLTPDGVEAAYAFGYDAAMGGQIVVSGLAFGADCKAHKGAVCAAFDSMADNYEKACDCGKTAAVLPCGIDAVVPLSNRKLAEQILQSGGCILSEYAPGTESLPFRYVQRNRIIAGLAEATVVIQAPVGSGALITADFALGYNRDVVFHESAISAEAQKVSDLALHKLKTQVFCKEQKKSKLARNIQSYIESGAPVIKNYEEYKACMSDLPGKHSLQLSLNLEGV